LTYQYSSLIIIPHLPEIEKKSEYPRLKEK